MNNMKMLKLYRELAHTALREYPNPITGVAELRRIRENVRSITKDGTDEQMKRACGYLRYSINELQGTIQLAKYRAIKKTYYSERDSD